MLPCGNGNPLLPHLLNQEKLNVQICEISRLKKFCSHFYRCWVNQTKHTCGQHPVMTLIHYPVKGHKGRSFLFGKACESIQGFSASAPKNSSSSPLSMLVKGQRGWRIENKGVKRNLSCVLPQTSHPDPLPLPHRDAVRMTEVMPMNYEAKHGLNAQ